MLEFKIPVLHERDDYDDFAMYFLAQMGIEGLFPLLFYSCVGGEEIIEHPGNPPKYQANLAFEGSTAALDCFTNRMEQYRLALEPYEKQQKRIERLKKILFDSVHTSLWLIITDKELPEAWLVL